MEVKIEITENLNIESAKQVKDISKELIETCKNCGVVEFNYSHDYFKICIKQNQETLTYSNLEDRILKLENIYEEYKNSEIKKLQTKNKFLKEQIQGENK